MQLVDAFSLRRPGRDVLGRSLVHVLIATLGLGLVPINAEASIPTAPPPDPRPLEHHDHFMSGPTGLAIEIVVADVSRLTKSAFGELLEHAGSDPQPYSFAGEPYDPNVGFQYHRARWMDPTTGRFLGMDPFEGRAFDPATLHRYLYVSADPVNKIDATGLFFTMADMSAALGSLTTLAAIALPRLTSVLAVVNQNFFRIQRTIEYIDFAFTTIAAVISATEILERMAGQLRGASEVYSPGPGPRGLQVGRVAGQNLGDNFPTIDHFEGGTAVSIKSTTAVSNQGNLLGRIETWAFQLDSIDRRLDGKTASGTPIRILPTDIVSRGLLVVIPDEMSTLQASSFFARVRQISQRYRTSIRVIPVRGLRGP